MHFPSLLSASLLSASLLSASLLSGCHVPEHEFNESNSDTLTTHYAICQDSPRDEDCIANATEMNWNVLFAAPYLRSTEPRAVMGQIATVGASASYIFHTACHDNEVELPPGFDDWSYPALTVRLDPTPVFENQQRMHEKDLDTLLTIQTNRITATANNNAIGCVSLEGDDEACSVAERVSILNSELLESDCTFEVKVEALPSSERSTGSFKLGFHIEAVGARYRCTDDEDQRFDEYSCTIDRHPEF